MSDCGCSQRCTCTVTAGPGVTVDGNGSTTHPYIISAGAAALPTPVQAGDTPTVDTTVSGAGTAADPYVVSAQVVLDPTPPGGGTNLVHAGPDGVYVECADVRGCLSAGDGVAFDPGTGEIAARPSADAGNTVTIGGDGGLYSAGGSSTPTAVQAADTPTVDTTITGTGTAADPYEVSAAVILDPAPPGGGSNLVHAGPDGVYVECADVRGCLSAGDGVAFDPATGEIAARPSADAGNTVTIGGDGGLYAPASGGTPTVVEAGTGVTVTGAGTPADPYEVSTTPPETGCGLTGDGSTTAPLAAVVAAWPYACDVDDNAGGVYCDSAGQLRSEPRGSITFLQDLQELNPANVTVPAAVDTEVATHVLTVPNPDGCRPAFVIMEGEVDADFTLPPGAGAALGIASDEMSYLRNSGSTVIQDTHIQGTKVVNGGTIPPSGTLTFTLSIRMGKGSGGATYNRIQSYLRAFVIVL